MQKSTVRLLVIHTLPLLHICACLAIEFTRAGWGFLTVADIPMSAVIIALGYNYDYPLLWFGVLGTVWWYLLSLEADILIRRSSAKSAARAAVSDGRRPDAK
jgi:hypothetical protein